ncbi:tetratricopeptide repeat protein [Phaeobacter sp. HF9A]|uniref:tetratricopeptide repeat protein n=1 Tax=Phaeobacter sp. HF9A TaxID=2721561 RepID=UPI0014309316|nr:tetratricopeptide repeat protein [Phaeobacter sp. HF9A]NIZ14226.1 tetratricopeptide repeat protein [Phaeobacter sp. HF9A]
MPLAHSPQPPIEMPLGVLNAAPLCPEGDDAPARYADPLPAELIERIATVFNAGKFDETSSVCSRLLKDFKTSAFLWTMMGLALARKNNFDDALTCLNKAQELAPALPKAHVGMAEVYAAQGRTQDADSHFGIALRLDDTDVSLLNNYASFLSATGRPDAARHLLERACTLAPDNGILFYNYANTEISLSNDEKARELYQTALRLDPDLRQARFNHAQLLCNDREFVSAVAEFEKVLAQKPDDDRARSYKLHAMAMLNDFRWIEEYQTHRRQLGLRDAAIQPFAALMLEDNPDLLRVRIQAHARTHFPLTQAAPTLKSRPDARPERLKVGYFSADFHDHATMYLLGGLLRSHDKSRFEIHAFSYGAPRDDKMRATARAYADHFHDCFGLSDKQLIEVARAQDLDIAIDLKGFTGHSRCAIFAERLAPVHISYLGFPGTLGTPAMDYLITDSVVSPPGSERHFDEHLIRMPHSYQPNDNQRAIAPQTLSRADCGLPEDGFVFCCLNNCYKITPRELDIWMRLLTQVKGSVLWLLSGGAESEANLRAAAKSRGVAPDRLIFAEKMEQDDHLARLQRADLFLDTFTVNAHTTCSDALWAGLPVLTLPGKQFAARVAASLLSAAGLHEMIADSESDYEARALHLAQTPEELRSLRNKLAQQRDSAPLFDTAGYSRNLEQALDIAYDRWRMGLAPEHLSIAP